MLRVSPRRRLIASGLRDISGEMTRELPGFAFAQLGDVGGVVAAVPGVLEQQPIYGEEAWVFGVAKGAGEIFFLQRAPQADPALVQRIEQRQGNIYWGRLGVGEFGPARFFVGLDGRLLLGEGEPQARVGVQVRDQFFKWGGGSR